MKVKIRDKRSDYFPVSTGLRQRCLLSSLLFSLYPSMSPSIMESKLKRCGVKCGGLYLSGLLFTDDTSRFGEDVQGLEHSFGTLEEWC